MFQNLTNRLTSAFKQLRGQGRLTEANIQEALADVRRALIEADVALPVAKAFIENVQSKALGQTVTQSLNPGQEFIKIVYNELTHLLGDKAEPLNTKANPPLVILLAGLQGSGKTTTSAKLAKLLMLQGKKVILASCDTYRPAAIQQLKTLSQQIQCGFVETELSDPIKRAVYAVSEAKTKLCDVLIVDTAGRLHVDDTMMQEIQTIHQTIYPIETLFVVDSMTGQDAAHTAKAFHDRLPLTGVILTKCDGDARGGAALSLRSITGKPIKFIGIGEKIDNFEIFHPERMASRILNMGDILSLIEEAHAKIDKEHAEKLAKKVRTGKSFTLSDYQDQLLQMQKMGGLSSLLQKLPGMATLPKNMSGFDDKVVKKTVAMINSMTLHERKFPKIISGSRKERIARGSGTQIQDVNKLLKQFTQMQKMMKKMSKPGMMKHMMRNFQKLIPSHS